MNKKTWLVILMCTFILSWLAFSQEKTQQRQEIIKFSHKFHIQEVEAECTDCHVSVEGSTSESDNLLPSMADCANCHDVEDDESCTQCHFEDEQTWLPFENPTRELNFNHKFHIEQEGVSCETCHKNLAEVDFSDAQSLPAMADCSSCHNNQQATLECVNCHTSTLNLRPTNHTADYLVTHKTIARIDRSDCATCHTENDCSECHEGASLITTSLGSNADVQAPRYPSASGTQGLVIQRVHDLNFRYTHPLEAEGRSRECSVCHESRSFCQDCHESEGVDVAGKPIWHGGPDWGALAGVIGTGGGRHAELARRDIESCAACHDTQGDDPTCVLCHRDFDGVRGTDPRTHESGFANRFSSGSSFHDDDSATCFACHTDTGQAGMGFCGYCHGMKRN